MWRKNAIDILVKNTRIDEDRDNHSETKKEVLLPGTEIF